MEAAKSGLKSVETGKLPDFEVKAVYGGFEAGDYPKLALIVNGSVRQYEPSKQFEGDLPVVGAPVHVEFEGYRVNVTAVARSGSHYTRTVETLRVISIKAAKA